MRTRQDLERRKTSRRTLETHVHAKLRYDEALIRVIVLDVSREGMKLSVPNEIEVGTGVVISLLGVDITAVVHWCHSGMVGLQLLKNLDRNTMIALDQTQKKLSKSRYDAPSSSLSSSIR